MMMMMAMMLIASSLTWLEAQPGPHLFLDSSAPLVTKTLRLANLIMIFLPKISILPVYAQHCVIPPAPHPS